MKEGRDVLERCGEKRRHVGHDDYHFKQVVAGEKSAEDDVFAVRGGQKRLVLGQMQRQAHCEAPVVA